MNTFNVMSFNIRYGTAPDGDHSWVYRKNLVIHRILSFAPDLLGIQECRDDDQAVFVKNNLAEFQFHGVQRGKHGDAALEMAPLLFKKSVFQHLEQGCFWLSKTPAIAHSQSWDSVFPRTAIWAKLMHVPSGKFLNFINVHFDYQPITVKESARVLRNWLEENVKSEPFIITGDFNATKESFAYQHLLNSNLLSDAFREANPTYKEEHTFHGYAQSSLASAIDWILVSRHFEVLSSQVDRFLLDECYPSDHYPITATLRWKETL